MARPGSSSGVVRVTDDERREVAGDLRGMAIRSYIRYKEQFFDDLAETVVGFEDFHDFNVVLEKLADLIDPTCQNKQIAYNRAAPIEFRTDNFSCSACGETFCADGDGVNHPIDWAFCPNCGARVTEKEEDDGER